jgi:hypothetical protein
VATVYRGILPNCLVAKNFYKIRIFVAIHRGMGLIFRDSESVVGIWCEDSFCKGAGTKEQASVNYY